MRKLIILLLIILAAFSVNAQVRPIYGNSSFNINGFSLSGLNASDSIFSFSPTVVSILKPLRLKGILSTPSSKSILVKGNSSDSATYQLLFTGSANDVLKGNGTFGTIAPNPYPWYDAQADSASTSDATATTLRTITIPDGSRGILEVRMDCINSSTAGSGLTGIKRVRFKKISGTLTLGTVEDEMAVERDGGLTSANFTITTSSNNIIIQVTGEAATNLKWRATWLLTANAIAL